MKTLISVTAGFITFALAVTLLYRVFGFGYEDLLGGEPLMLALAYALVVGLLDGAATTWLGAHRDLRDAGVLALMIALYAALTWFLSSGDSAIMLTSVIGLMAPSALLGGWVVLRFSRRAPTQVAA